MAREAPVSIRVWAIALIYTAAAQLTACFATAKHALSVDVDAHCSQDPLGNIDSWSWDWGDGGPVALGATASHTYATLGTYTVTLTVADNAANIATSTAEITLRAAHVDSYTGTMLIGTEADQTHLGCGAGHTVPVCAPGTTGTNAEQVFFTEDETGTAFSLKGALASVDTGSGVAGVMGVPDFDIGFVQCDGTALSISGTGGDEAGATPDVCSAGVYLAAGAASSYTLAFQ